jgi:curved DNA-binding protein CbpA
MTASPDPYQTLGVTRSATDAEVRAAYRRLVQLHHPDHNGGSVESARRFEAVQEAYAEVRRRRGAGSASTARASSAGGSSAAGRSSAAGQTSAGGSAASGSAAGGSSTAGGDPDLDGRLAAMERELARAREAREHAAREARRATEQTIRDVREMAGKRASDEDLGYVSTNDSFSQILDDAAAELGERFTEARDSPAGHRVSDLIDELTHKLTGEHDRKPK